MKKNLLPPLLSIVLFVIVASILLLPARRSGEIHILPGNGWTHAENVPLQWTNHGSFGPGYNWIRTEHGLRSAWFVRDQAIGGTRTFARVDPLNLILYILAAGVPSMITLLLARYVFRNHTNFA